MIRSLRALNKRQCRPWLRGMGTFCSGKALGSCGYALNGLLVLTKHPCSASLCAGPDVGDMLKS